MYISTVYEYIVRNGSCDDALEVARRHHEFDGCSGRRVKEKQKNNISIYYNSIRKTLLLAFQRARASV